jgi:DNA mismatch endonuclease (patch repair protein)
MARFKSEDTKPELDLRCALRRAGLLGYRANVRTILGKPDVVYTRWRVAVFVDGAFWHGHPDVFQFGTKGQYWDEKIARNQKRDQDVTARLVDDGWSVLRFWDLDVIKNADQVATKISAMLADRGRPSRGGLFQSRTS